MSPANAVSSRPSWVEYFTAITQAVSTRGDCSRKQVGAIIVDADQRIIATGYNGTQPGGPSCLKGHCPRGRATDEQLAEFDNSYDAGPFPCIAVHAEANALLNARASCVGASMFVTKEPCVNCWKLIRAAGIEVVNVHYPLGRI